MDNILWFCLGTPKRRHREETRQRSHGWEVAKLGFRAWRTSEHSHVTSRENCRAPAPNEITTPHWACSLSLISGQQPAILLLLLPHDGFESQHGSLRWCVQTTFFTSGYSSLDPCFQWESRTMTDSVWQTWEKELRAKPKPYKETLEFSRSSTSLWT